MSDSQKEAVFSFPVIDVPATSKNLQKLRESRGISVATLQQFLEMQNPQSIYTWENSNNKYLPRLDNLIILSKLYKVSIDDLIILQESEDSVLSISESRSPYGYKSETLDYIRINASKNVRIALGKYFDFKF
jgi:transcriptional regulator with XRE-family HTH domain